jgi:large repetitive protein
MLQTCTFRKHLPALCCALFSFLYSIAQNPIVTENALPGNPQSEWDISGAGSLTIQGFATDISVNKGETIHFKIKTDATAYAIDIYRLGYYNGDGARKVGTGTVTAALPQTQPDPLEDATLGLVDCGNWSESAHWNVPSTAVSGIYIAKLIRTDNSEASHIIFIVRDDASNSDLFFQTSDATWQAYNVYGGNSLYVGSTSFPAGHAAKVSYNRPFITRAGGGGGDPAEDWVFNAEYPMIRFLEKNGYNVTYTTNVDAARNGNLILNHKVFLSVGHDEYWSAGQRANVEAARNAGVHLAFFSGNEVYWKTRWENSTDGSNTPYRTLVCYKEGTVGEAVCGSKCDPSTEWTGLWREGCAFPSGGGCLPENSLSGQISWVGSTDAIRVPYQYKDLRFWRNTNITSLSPESEAVLPMGTLGYEWDWEQFPNSNPPGRITLSQTTSGGRMHKMSLYKHSSGAMVFGAGTVQWTWGLDSVHDRGNLPADARMQQATVNLLGDMGVQPATLQPDLVTPVASTDITAPQSIIVSPVDGTDIVGGTQTTISGTASDAGGVIAGVEISLDGGSTWSVANGTTSWSYSFTPTAIGPIVVKVRAFDDSGNMEGTGSTNSITLDVVNAICPCTIYHPTDVPATTNTFDNQGGMEMGVRFRTNTDGWITGLRFYKSTNDVGNHVGSLWSANGDLLGQVTFINETASGWQQVTFGTPIQVTAGVTYIASYFSPTGFYAQTPQYFWDEIFNAPLTAFENSSATLNGLFAYTNSPTFPTGSYDATNYWVDVVFDLTVTPDTTPPVMVSEFPASNESNVDINVDPKAYLSEFIDPASVTTSTFELRGPGGVLVPASVNALQGQAILSPNSLLARSTMYTATIKGGSGGVKDIAGNSLQSDFSWSFTTADPPALPPVDGPGGPILVITSASNPFSTYTSEVLRAEGLNEFFVQDISAVTSTVLNNYDVVILGEVPVTAAEASMLSTWVNAGGTLIAFKPSTELSSLLGITKQAGSVAEGYILVNTTAGTPGAGIVNQTMQFHGSSDIYTLNGATSLASLYSNATTATGNPAVTSINVGSNGGKAIAFTYDLNRSIIYTRQGNPAWAGTERDNQQGPIRSDDLFFGGTDPDWVDFNKIAIPQADEQQRLLVNIILQGNMHKKPLPRFWFLPSDHKAAIVMTGDDHNLDGTVGQFNHFKTLGPNTAQDVADWKAIRGTSYIYVGSMSDADVASFQADGFEISLHANTSCQNFTPSSFENFLSTQLNILNGQLPSLNPCVTHRTHCVAWSDWASAAKIESQYGMRLDANYYYWPASWVLDRPGLFTGSGMPMRFADIDGSMIDCYQLTTQLSDEANINYSLHANSLLDKAIGPEGYYGVFCANMHTDLSVHPGANAIIASALARNVPVISAKQLLTWLDGRNGSSFGNITWNTNQLSFSVTALAAAHNLRGMVPFISDAGQLLTLTLNGNSVSYDIKTVKGMQYAFFNAQTGNYVATYGAATTGILTGTVVLQGCPPAPNAQWSVPVQVDLYTPGNTTTPAHTYNVTTDQTGIFTVNNIPIGTYIIAVKNPKTLKVVLTNQSISGGNNSINFGTLRAGDATNDNIVTLDDFSLLLNSFDKVVGDPGFDPRADFNNDGIVTLDDFSLLLINFDTIGDTP